MKRVCGVVLCGVWCNVVGYFTFLLLLLLLFLLLLLLLFLLLFLFLWPTFCFPKRNIIFPLLFPLHHFIHIHIVPFHSLSPPQKQQIKSTGICFRTFFNFIPKPPARWNSVQSHSHANCILCIRQRQAHGWRRSGWCRH